MHPITPCLWFDSQAEQAAELYVSLFPGARRLSTTLYPEGAPGLAGSVMLVDIELNGSPLQLLNGGPLFPFTEAISLVATVETQDEIDRLWDGLIDDGGQPSQCGWLKDRFGVSWQVVPAGLQEMAADPERFARGMQAVLGMTKLDIAQINAAADAR
ncbi:MAG TPA: VOC family protein [Actinotalea sp.]|jgi:predicted 3-demethylubiquinone-9 3-methyltransferase (glyoxalase superfamily)